MTLSLGDKVKLKAPLSYLKTAENMSMLRPPDLVSLEEIGEIVGLRAFGDVEVSFRRGTFLIPMEKLSLISSSEI